MEKPVMLPDSKINLVKLKEDVQEYINYMNGEVDGEPHEDVWGDYEHYILESAVEALFGPDVWNFINERMK